MKKVSIFLLFIILYKITFASDLHMSYRYIFDQGIGSKSNVIISVRDSDIPFIIQFNGTNYLVVSNTAIYAHKPLAGSGYSISNVFDFAVSPFTNNAVIAWNSSIGKWTPAAQAYSTNDLVSINYAINSTNVVRQTATNQADILAETRTNGLASITYVDITINTNGLASIIYVDAKTNGIASIIYTDNAINVVRQTATNQADILAGLRTNGLASIVYVNLKDTNNLASTIYTDNATNIVRQTATNQADILAGLRTNGLASITYVDSITNNLASIIYADNATNIVRQTATNQADILAGLRTNGLASITYVDSITNNLASVIYVNNATNIVRQTATNQADILAGLRTNGLASITYVDSITNNLASIIYTDNATNIVRQTATNQTYAIMLTRLTNKPSFRVYQATNQNLAANTITKITCTNLVYEYGQSSGFGWDSTTYSYRPPIAGRYQFSMTIYTDFPTGIVNNYQGALFCTNNNTVSSGRYWILYQGQERRGTVYMGSGIRQFDLTTNHTISAYVYSGATTGCLKGAINTNVNIQFDGELLAPLQ